MYRFLIYLGLVFMVLLSGCNSHREKAINLSDEHHVLNFSRMEVLADCNHAKSYYYKKMNFFFIQENHNDECANALSSHESSMQFANISPKGFELKKVDSELRGILLKTLDVIFLDESDYSKVYYWIREDMDGFSAEVDMNNCCSKTPIRLGENLSVLYSNQMGVNQRSEYLTSVKYWIFYLTKEDKGIEVPGLEVFKKTSGNKVQVAFISNSDIGIDYVIPKNVEKIYMSNISLYGDVKVPVLEDRKVRQVMWVKPYIHDLNEFEH